ncbi:hypothetical protein CAPTEDRAFT_116102 [Capitella teleta]|uniref:Anti-proliferative protein domain-containing protein n=1 Tax=Capitella teleta TaxID=283909 RepID=R7T8D7_CAPTE|nr:hypothetical protein CAPTEDRAFT_116102 [Capitella teleta]|eukprot:ELT89890.1 hypothetical protein CAPTEDRAFT_116102 [Capitella teleta]
MLEEINIGGLFLTRLIGLRSSISEEDASEFFKCFKNVFLDRNQDHWYEHSPSKGQGYRCISTPGEGCPDPVLLMVTKKCKIRYCDLKLPLEVYLWIDPGEVSCRSGHCIIVSESLLSLIL